MTKALAGYPYSTESVDYTVDDRWEAEQRLECATSELGEDHELDIGRVVAEVSAALVLIHAVAETDLLVFVRGRPDQPVSRSTHER
jgi:hypothetical protein